MIWVRDEGETSFWLDATPVVVETQEQPYSAIPCGVIYLCMYSVPPLMSTVKQPANGGCRHAAFRAVAKETAGCTRGRGGGGGRREGGTLHVFQCFK